MQTISKLTIPRNEDAIFEDIGYEPHWADKVEMFPLLNVYGKDENGKQTVKNIVSLFAPIINSLIMRRYGGRYIGMTPYSRWVQMFEGDIIEAVNREAPVLMAIYKSKGIDILDAGSTGHRSKGVHSDFPQEALNPDEESYASNADDLVERQENFAPQLDTYKAYDDPAAPYHDPLNLIVDSVDCCFSHLVR